MSSSQTLINNKTGKITENNDNKRTSSIFMTKSSFKMDVSFEKNEFNRMKSLTVTEAPMEEFNNHLKHFMKNFMTHLVDEVCLYSEKINYLEEYFNEFNVNEFSSKEEKEIKLQAEKKHISTRSIENDQTNEDTKYHKIIPVILQNEIQMDSGKYGWFAIFYIK